jgi:tryptophan-rich sensory protein
LHQVKTSPVDSIAQHRATHDSTREGFMLWTIAVILGVLWLLGMVSSTTMGGFVHILLVLAVVVVVINLIQGRSIA